MTTVAKMTVTELAVAAYGVWLDLPEAERTSLSRTYANTWQICRLTESEAVTPNEVSRTRILFFYNACLNAR